MNGVEYQQCHMAFRQHPLSHVAAASKRLCPLLPDDQKDFSFATLL